MRSIMSCLVVSCVFGLGVVLAQNETAKPGDSAKLSRPDPAAMIKQVESALENADKLEAEVKSEEGRKALMSLKSELRSLRDGLKLLPTTKPAFFEPGWPKETKKAPVRLRVTIEQQLLRQKEKEFRVAVVPAGVGGTQWYVQGARLISPKSAMTVYLGGDNVPTDEEFTVLLVAAPSGALHEGQMKTEDIDQQKVEVMDSITITRNSR